MIERAVYRTTLFLALLPLVACTGDSNDTNAGPNVINIYNWADYIARYEYWDSAD